METAPATPEAFVALVRGQAAEPELLARYQAYATDMLLALNNAQPWFDPEYADLDDDERQRYVEAQAARLAPELFRFVQSWALLRLERASEWRPRG